MRYFHFGQIMSILFFPIVIMMASTSAQPTEEAYANLDLNDNENLDVEIDANLLNEVPPEFT